jgi:single-stranded-DNA-specific exonuclease
MHLHSARNPIAARWTLRPTDTGLANRLAASLKLHPVVARVLASRGVGEGEECDNFLAPQLATLRDPFELHGMDTAVARVLVALQKGEKIAVFGDYDVDGICSTAVMVLTLRLLGSDPVVFIPHRVHDGYGVSTSRLSEIAAQGVTLVITVDTGITAIDEVEHARTLGMDVIVTDHHIAGEALPGAHAVVNPNLPGREYAGGALCGVGVAFKLAHGLLKGAKHDSLAARAFLKSLLDLVALGTIADVVPLRGENRVFARHGLENLRQSQRPGIQALMEVARVRVDRLNAEHVGFVLGPRLNAAGRTDHAITALELLLTDSQERAVEIANYLDALNRRRRDEEKEILTASLALADEQINRGEDAFLVVAGKTYHLGVVGIVAARLAEKFHLPAVVMRIEEAVARGSARSIPGFDVHQALGAVEEYLIGFGGHAAAAGVRVESGRLSDFRGAINDYARTVFAQHDLSPERLIDAELEAPEFEWGLWKDLQRLQPFGESNPEPVFLMRSLRASGAPRIVGTGHLRVRLQTGGYSFQAIGFNMADRIGLMDDPSAEVDALFRPSVNEWNGQTTLEMSLVDLRPAV